MCESTVYIEGKGQRELVMDNVALITALGDKITLMGLLGEKKTITGRIVRIDSEKHEVVLE